MSFGSNKSISTIGKGYTAPGHATTGAVTANPHPQAGASIPGSVQANPNPQPIAQQNGGAGGVTANTNPQIATAGLPTTATLGGGGSLGQDPAYLAFLRTSGINQADASATAQNQLDAINNELQRRLPDLAFQGELAQKQIAGNMESRGILRSGERFVAGADQARQQGLQQAQLVGTAGDQQAAIRLQLAQQLAAIQRNVAEQGLNSAGTVYGG